MPILVDQPDKLSLDDFSAGISGYEDIAFLPIEKNSFTRGFTVFGILDRVKCFVMIIDHVGMTVYQMEDVMTHLCIRNQIYEV